MEPDSSLLHSQVPATCLPSYTILPIALEPPYIIELTPHTFIRWYSAMTYAALLPR